MEFGSDFHYIDTFFSHRAHLTDVYHNAVLMADGRQCIVALVRQYGWKRMWMPEYFCYEVIASVVEMTGIKVMFYHDQPLVVDEQKMVEILPFEKGDVLLRVNYFGLREHRSNKNIPVPVIEDHSHDLLGHWALYSDADWCIASLRKSLPVPEGGMMWSPKGFSCSVPMENIGEKEEIATTRWEGMQMKAAYLNGITMKKESFRKKYLETEEWFEYADVQPIDQRSKEYIERLDINAWMGAKLRNWRLLHKLVSADCLLPEDASCTPFSFVLLTENKETRERLRHHLIEQAVYPAVLWNVPDNCSEDVQNFSHRMLSIHCDGRYTENDIRQLANIINRSF